MKLQLLEFSIVITAQHHNPTVLNKDFLSRNQIIPDEWGWEVEGEQITTPPFSRVPYQNKVVIEVELDKWKIAESQAELTPAASKIPEIAVKYVETLPHVRYTAIGINFKSIVEYEKPDKFITELLLNGKNCSWDGGEIRTGNLQIVYDLSDGTVLNAYFRSGKVTSGPREGTSVLSFDGNFHQSLEESALEQIKSNAHLIDRNWALYNRLFETVVAKENTHGSSS